MTKPHYQETTLTIVQAKPLGMSSVGAEQKTLPKNTAFFSGPVFKAFPDGLMQTTIWGGGGKQDTSTA